MQALVIGGTGMLSDLAIWLAEKYQCVSVIGRSWPRLERLVTRAGQLSERIIPISVDYTDHEMLTDAIRKNLWRNGPADLVVAWVRSGNNDALEAVAREISSHSHEPWRLFQVRGSVGFKKRSTPRLPEEVLYREVVLGFRIEGGHSRWLTDEEIWKGVRDSILEDRDLSIVGQIDPPDLMPQ